jgi:hypothetical protein
MTFGGEAEEGRLLTSTRSSSSTTENIAQPANKLLQLIDPSLGETTQISGEVSLSVDHFAFRLASPGPAGSASRSKGTGSTTSVRNEEAQCGRRWFNWSPT